MESKICINSIVCSPTCKGYQQRKSSISNLLAISEGDLPTTNVFPLPGNAGFVSPATVGTVGHASTCVTHVPWCMPWSLTSGFLWSLWRGKRSRNSQRMHNPQFYVCVRGPWRHYGLRLIISTRSQQEFVDDIQYRKSGTANRLIDGKINRQLDRHPQTHRQTNRYTNRKVKDYIYIYIYTPPLQQVFLIRQSWCSIWQWQSTQLPSPREQVI